MRLVLASLLLCAAPLAAQSPGPDDAEIRRRGADLTRWLLVGKADSALTLLSDRLRDGMGGRDGLAQVSADLASDLGRETAVHMESVTHGRGLTEYWRLMSFSEVDGEPFVFHWVFDAAGLAVGLGLTPLSETPAPQE